VLLHSPLRLAKMSERFSRRSSTSSRSGASDRYSNPNIFSDEYALDPPDVPDSASIDDTEPTHDSTNQPTDNPRSRNRSISSNSTSSISNQPLSTPYQPAGQRDVACFLPNRTLSRASNAFSDVHRASSTSSRFTMPRSQSPYVGATGPSHPYGMYPQITRTSSIASASTVRPVERPFVAPSGPEHPYAMYPQNTVPEEDDVSMAQAVIPLGFPGMGRQYQTGAPRGRDDIADIVGSDGHVEELPPYTRYADEFASKERPPSVLVGVVAGPDNAPQDVAISPQSSRTQYSDTGVELNTAASKNSESESSGSFKEKIKQKSKQRICGGLPFWIVFVIVGVLLLGVILGAIIGGVVGSRKASVTNTEPEPNQSPS
jgi:hypothetical protein